MKIYQLKTPQQFLDSIEGHGLSIEVAMYSYAEDVATKFAAECVNEALGNQPMKVSNALHIAIDKKFQSIEWPDAKS